MKIAACCGILKLQRCKNTNLSKNGVVTMNTKINVLLADDSQEFRRLLKGALEENQDIVVAGSAGDGEELVRMTAELLSLIHI